jgi:ribose 5-phosphate isomerase
MKLMKSTVSLMLSKAEVALYSEKKMVANIADKVIWIMDSSKVVD